MTPELRELFREELIRQLAAIGPVGVKVVNLKLSSREKGFEPTDSEIDAALDYLAGKGFAEIKDKAISPALKRWKITAAGIDYAEQEGLA